MGGLGFRVCGLAFGVEAKRNVQVSVEGSGEIVCRVKCSGFGEIFRVRFRVWQTSRRVGVLQNGSEAANRPQTCGDRIRVGEVSHGEKMSLRGTDPESNITEYTLVYEYYLQPSE